MPVNCVTHPDRQAIGKCFKCAKAYCLDCLDMDSGRPICTDCKAQQPAAEVPPPAAKPQPKFNAMPTPVYTAPPAPTTPPPSKRATQISLDDLFDAPVKKPAASAPAPEPKPAPVPAEDPLKQMKSGVAVPSMAMMESVKAEPAPAPTPLTMDAPVQHPAIPAKPTHSFTPGTVSFKDLHMPKHNRFVQLVLSFWEPFWEKTQGLSARLRVPVYVIAGVFLLSVVVLVIWVAGKMAPAPVSLVEAVPVIQVVPIPASQVSDLDATAFSDLQNQLGPLNFTQMTQMTVPQLPTPNFFDVGIKPEASMYCEVLKMPDQVAPHLAFITVFTNGVWYSTNGWTGNDQRLEYLVSEFVPTASAKQLYDQHVQGVEELKKKNGWQPQLVSLNRYISALSDHLRWYITSQNIPAYQADFNSWH